MFHQNYEMENIDNDIQFKNVLDIYLLVVWANIIPRGCFLQT